MDNKKRLVYGRKRIRVKTAKDPQWRLGWKFDRDDKKNFNMIYFSEHTDGGERNMYRNTESPPRDKKQKFPYRNSQSVQHVNDSNTDICYL